MVNAFAFASASLIEKLGGKIEEIGFVVELPSLGGRQKLSKEFKKKFQDEIITGLCEFSSYLLNDCRARQEQLSSSEFVEKR